MSKSNDREIAIQNILKIIKEQANSKLWNKVFVQKIEEFIVELLSESKWSSIGVEVSNDKNTIILKPNDIPKLNEEGGSSHYVTYEINFNQELNQTAYVSKKYSYQLDRHKNGSYYIEAVIDAKSDIYDKSGKKTYTSSYYDVCKFDENMKETAIIDKCTPKFERGLLIGEAKTACVPNYNKKYRYGDTSVVRSFGQHVVNGEYSNIGLSFDDIFENNKLFITDSYGNLYYNHEGNTSRIHDNPHDTIMKIQELYQKYNDDGVFIEQDFFDEFSQYVDSMLDKFNNQK